MDKLKILTASGKHFQGAYNTCLTKQSAIQLSKTSTISLKFQMPWSIIFHSERKQTVQTMRAYQNNPIPIDQEYLDKLKIPNVSSKHFPSRKKIDSANHACLTKQSNSNWSRIFRQAQNSKCLEQKISITKENRHTCLANETICNPIVQE